MVNTERLEKGLYWQRAFKLVEGCEKISPGCDNCWSEAETCMRAFHPNNKIGNRARAVTLPYDSSNKESIDAFNGRITMREDNLDLPFTVKKPTVFAIWNDLFHEDVTDGFILDAYDVMMESPHHTFLILTKRSGRMSTHFHLKATTVHKTLPNVYHGVTVCNQDEADRNIPHLLKVPGKRFLSIEPMLGPIDFRIDCVRCSSYDEMTCQGHKKCPASMSGIHQVLLGGESGPNARPVHLNWIRSVRDQCETAGVPLFFKQWGEWYPGIKRINDKGKFRVCRGNVVEPYEHEERPRAFISFGCDGMTQRIGKKKAGRTLDGKTHDDLIWKG